MSSKDAIAKGYANLNDDLRYHLVEKAWFDQKQPDDAMRRDVDTTIAQSDQEVSNSAWGKLPDAERPDEPQGEIDPSDLYGNDPAPGPERDEMGEVDASDLYGDGPASTHDPDGPDQDIEHERD